MFDYSAAKWKTLSWEQRYATLDDAATEYIAGKPSASCKKFLARIIPPPNTPLYSRWADAQTATSRLAFIQIMALTISNHAKTLTQYISLANREDRICLKGTDAKKYFEQMIEKYSTIFESFELED